MADAAEFISVVDDITGSMESNGVAQPEQADGLFAYSLRCEIIGV